MSVKLEPYTPSAPVLARRIAKEAFANGWTPDDMRAAAHGLRGRAAAFSSRARAIVDAAEELDLAGEERRDAAAALRELATIWERSATWSELQVALERALSVQHGRSSGR